MPATRFPPGIAAGAQRRVLLLIEQMNQGPYDFLSALLADCRLAHIQAMAVSRVLPGG
jgi:hypothetical protein